MNNMNESNAADAERQWKPIDRNERRILGVLVEKAKTTPENYPLSLASLVAGSNQKSNHAPQMQLDEDDVTLALDKLRALGAVREVQGSGRVSKFRHAAYEWLGVDASGSAIRTLRDNPIFWGGLLEGLLGTPLIFVEWLRTG